MRMRLPAPCSARMAPSRCSCARARRNVLRLT
jgi:hypothetical protein